MEIGAAEIVVGVLGAGGLGALIAFRKTSAEAEAVSVATLRGIIEELRLELGRVRVENTELRERVVQLEERSR